jgi:hypothetical protein
MNAGVVLFQVPRCGRRAIQWIGSVDSARQSGGDLELGRMIFQTLLRVYARRTLNRFPCERSSG